MDQNQNLNVQPMLSEGQPLVGQAQPVPQAQLVQYQTSQPQPTAYQQVSQAQPMQQPMPQAMGGYPPVQPLPEARTAPKSNPSMFRGVTQSVFCECPSCSQATYTRVEVENSPMQWILCIIMFIFGLWCCCCIPFCVDSLKGGNHYCTNCGSSISIIKKWN